MTPSACSEPHIQGVFDMLKRQPERARFTGGLEARLLKPWHVDLLTELKPLCVYFAYDTPDDYYPLVDAGKLLREAGFMVKSHDLRCYVLIGYPQDTFDAAECRLWQTIDAGFYPMAMLYRDKTGKRNTDWARFQRSWARPAAIATMVKKRNACAARGEEETT